MTKTKRRTIGAFLFLIGLALYAALRHEPPWWEPTIVGVATSLAVFQGPLWYIRAKERRAQRREARVALDELIESLNIKVRVRHIPHGILEWHWQASYEHDGYRYTKEGSERTEYSARYEARRWCIRHHEKQVTEWAE